VISKYGKVRWVLTSACGRHSSVLRASACRPSCCDLSRASFMYKQAASLQSPLQGVRKRVVGGQHALG